jgi:NAD(P)-dependent dehydrogenase (short-subunit alcohol dehydrogenase family)
VKLRHPQSGAIYTLQDDGLVRVEQDGKKGLFDADGCWQSGKIRDADKHFIGWIGGPQLDSRGVLGSGRAAPPPAAATQRTTPVNAPPRFGARDGRPEGRKEMDLGLNGRKALITAASRGIGLAIAQTLADQGADVAICARGEAGLEAARKDIEARGVKVFTKVVDVSDGEALKAFIAEAGQALGGLDIFVANASGGAGMGEQAWQANFEVDVMSAVRGVEASLPFLTQSEAGSVVFISSTAALEYLGVPQAYNAMKAAMITHASDLAQALAPQGVRVNVVSPGPIFFEGGNWDMIKGAMPQIYEGALAQCAIGRMGTPEEVARAVVFLASPAASLVTGANLVTDGGFTKRVAF